MTPQTHPERLIDDAPVGLATIDAQLRFVRVNAALARMCEVPREALVGRSVQEVLPRRHHDVVELLQRVLRRGEAVLDVEVGDHDIPPNAIPRRWLASCFPVRDEAGDTVGLNLVVVDITERSAAEERVRALLRVSVGLAGALTPADVADVTVRHALPTLGAAAGAFVLVSESGRLEILRADGCPPGELERVRDGRPESRLLLARAIAERRPLYFRDEAERTAGPRDGLLLCTATDAGGAVDLPLMAGDRPVGGLEIVFGGSRDFARADRDFLDALARETAQALQRSRLYEAERAARKRSETQHEQGALLAQIVESAEDGIVSTTLDGTVTSWNTGAAGIFGYSADEMIGRPLDRIVPEDRRAETLELRRRIARGEPVRAHETVRVARGGRRVDVSLTIWPLRDPQGRIVGESRIDRDITARRQLEEQLLQAQKMESIGRLAGGVAHDFNNILTAITGYSELLISDLPDGSPTQEYAEAIRNAAERAASLTQQLLAFSRRQVLQPQVLDPNDVVGRMEPLIRRLIGEHIELDASLGATGSIRADRSQLEQVVLNLAVNARDAMPAGGRLSITSEDAEFDEAYAAEHFEVVPGRYVLLAVTDSGIGMDAATRARVFEPFFTTKEHGKGTGLGLATIYGIVRQSGGHIWLYSEPGHGTTFKIYFPRVSPATGERQPARQLAPSRGTETILLVEDEQAVREFARLVLERQGYRVLVAADGREALRVERGADERIDLLVTDVVMPGIGGPGLVARLLQRRPDLRVLYLSGYTQDAVAPGNELEAGRSFLGKPFTPDTLARKVREVLTTGD